MVAFEHPDNQAYHNASPSRDTIIAGSIFQQESPEVQSSPVLARLVRIRSFVGWF